MFSLEDRKDKYGGWYEKKDKWFTDLPDWKEHFVCKLLEGWNKLPDSRRLDIFG